MITPFLTNQNIVLFTVDQIRISTSFRLKDVVGNCPPHQLSNLPSNIRLLIRSISAGATSGGEHYSKPKDQAPVYDPKIPTRVIKVDGFDVIMLHAAQLPGLRWMVHTIDFNPGKVLYGHNGRILTVKEVHLALSILIELVTPLLHISDDWIHILPGLHINSRASCDSIEIPSHVLDADGAILKAFSHGKHSDINLLPFNARQGESVTFASANDDLWVRIYRKDIQMRKTHRKKVNDPQPVLRIEVRLRKDKLSQYLHAGVWETIQGTSRLVSFTPGPIKQAFMEVMTKFDGCYSRVPASDGIPSDAKLGRMMGWVANQTGLSIHEQFDYYRKRFLAECKVGSVNNAKSTLLMAARDEQSLLSPIKLEELFSEAAWHSQPVIEVPELEAMTQARHRGIGINPLVANVYGSNQPSSPKPWTPHISEHDL